MQTARKMFLKQAVMTVALVGICTFSGCHKPTTEGVGVVGSGPVGACSETWSDNYCDSTNQCLSATCTVNLVANGTSATAKIQGQNPQSPKDKFICVKPGASLLWQSPPSVMNAPNQFVADFGPISPWQSTKTYVVGGGGTTDTETPAISSTKCFKYDLFVCNSAPNTTGAVTCGIDDPKIIVGN